MIVQLTVKAEAYDLIKIGVPTTILANLPMPLSMPMDMITGKTPLDEFNRDKIGVTCVHFFLTSTDPDIVRFREGLPSSYEDFPYTFEVLSILSMQKLKNPMGDVLHMSLSPTAAEMQRRLRAEDVLPAHVAEALGDATNDVCMCCQLNEDIYEVLTKFQSEKAINCPKCGATLHVESLEPVSVQEANYYRPDQHIGIYPTCHCSNPECNAVIALIPTEITWNANHDVCYTGGADYMANSFTPESAEEEIKEIFNKRLWPSIKQFVERRLNPQDQSDDDLSVDFHLRLWAERDFTHAMCEYWYKHGMKE